MALALDAEGRDDIAVASASERLEAEAEIRFARLERGLRYLDNVAQLAPLLGLFGTVLGMIEAFQALQDAGSQVDPSVLAGGIWVALLTTAVGLVVAMPTSVALQLAGRPHGRRTRDRRTRHPDGAGPHGSKPAAAAKAGGAGQPALA